MASADRFLSAELEKDTAVPAGNYGFTAGETAVTIKWNGGSLEEFVNAFNRRAGNTFRSRIINASGGKKILLIESLKTGAENTMHFEKDALTFAKDIGMMGPAHNADIVFGPAHTDRTLPAPIAREQSGLPELSAGAVTEDGVSLPPRTAVAIALPDDVKARPNDRLRFTVSATPVDDITVLLNSHEAAPELPAAGVVTFNDITVPNFPSDTTLPVVERPPEPLVPIVTDQIISIVMEDGSERIVKTPQLFSETESVVEINMTDYPGMTGIAVRNRNTGTALTLSLLTASDPATSDGYVPLNPVTTADDAVIKYEGITIRRPTNTIDDVIPDITLTVSNKTDRPATITIEPDIESAKESLITFVGQYNQAIAEINILSQTRPELIEELTYLTEAEQAAQREKLGLFQGDFTLTNIKSALQSIVSSQYRADNDTAITLLSQLGIATNATRSSIGYNASRLRGYLEIDERMLDRVLKENMEDIKKLFGYDSDGDLIIDTGIGYELDQQLGAYTQSNGILTTRVNTLNSRIQTSEQRISRLETQLERREMQLRQQFGEMESALDSLEAQQNAITNFTRQNQRNNQ